MFYSVSTPYQRLLKGHKSNSSLSAKMLLVIVFAVFCSAAVMPVSMADVVYLKSATGNPETEKTMEGFVVKVSDDEVIIKTTDGISMPLSRKSVSRIEFKPLRIEPTNGIKTGATTSSSSGFSKPELEPLTSEPTVSGNTTTTDPHYAYGEATSKPSTTTSTDYTTQPAQRPLLQHLYRFPESDNRYDERVFVTLSRFKGSRTNKVYAGLYNFNDKGTFWIRLPNSAESTTEVVFDVFGRRNQGSFGESFDVQARFLDEWGNLVADSSRESYTNPSGMEGNRVEEWFYLLENISGLGGSKKVTWNVPPRTKTIEIRVLSSENNTAGNPGVTHHLVGYLGNVVVSVSDTGHSASAQ